jgi:hypothetical protein
MNTPEPLGSHSTCPGYNLPTRDPGSFGKDHPSDVPPGKARGYSSETA